MNRNDVTEMIIGAKIAKGLKWSEVAPQVGLSKEWVTAACLGQMTFTAEQAAIVGRIFDLPAKAIAWLQVVPSKDSINSVVSTDPLLHRFHKLVQVYGTTFKNSSMKTLEMASCRPSTSR